MAGHLRSTCSESQPAATIARLSVSRALRELVDDLPRRGKDVSRSPEGEHFTIARPFLPPEHRIRRWHRIHKHCRGWRIRAFHLVRRSLRIPRNMVWKGAFVPIQVVRE